MKTQRIIFFFIPAIMHGSSPLVVKFFAPSVYPPKSGVVDIDIKVLDHGHKIKIIKTHDSIQNPDAVKFARLSTEKWQFNRSSNQIFSIRYIYQMVPDDTDPSLLGVQFTAPYTISIYYTSKSINTKDNNN